MSIKYIQITKDEWVKRGKSQRRIVIDGIKYEDYLVVFITAYQEYAITAFKFNAIDFLLKPVGFSICWP